jgi:hypothetical protein
MNAAPTIRRHEALITGLENIYKVLVELHCIDPLDISYPDPSREFPTAFWAEMGLNAEVLELLPKLPYLLHSDTLIGPDMYSFPYLNTIHRGEARDLRFECSDEILGPHMVRITRGRQEDGVTWLYDTRDGT